MAKSSSGIKIRLTKGSATGTPITITAVKAAKVPTISTTGVTEGDVLKFGIIGYPDLDGKTFIAGKVTATEVEVLTGKDGTSITGTLAKTPLVTAYSDTDQLTLCLSSIGLNTNTPGEINVATYCDPSASIPGAVASAGSLSLGGYVDVNSLDYKEIVDAESDGLERVLTIVLPGNGSIVAPVKFKSLAWDLPLEGAIAFSAEATLLTKPRHLF